MFVISHVLQPLIINDLENWSELVVIYKAAVRELTTKLDILDSEYELIHQYNPIEHIKSRIKMPNSIMHKLEKKHLEVSVENAKEHIYDIAGVRVVCAFIDDIYFLQEVLVRQNDIEVIEVKDYIKHPKPNGYRSLHLIIKVPVFLSFKTHDVPVEVQIRTVAMDTWASLEHKLNYKENTKCDAHIKSQLLDCAHIAYDLDARMQAIKDEMRNLK